MSPEKKMDPMLLAACAAKTYNAHHLMAYAQLGTDLTIQQISPNFASMAPSQPLPEEEILAQGLTDVLWEFVGVTEELQDIIKGNSDMFRLEHVNREQPDGSINYLTFLVYPLEQDPAQNGLLLLVEDSTAYGRLHHELVQDRNELRLLQRRLSATNQELIKLDRMKSIFLSMAAHDLRTPLSAIHGYSDLMLMDLSDAKQPLYDEYLQVIHLQSARLNQLIDDILDLDLIERDQLTVDARPCNVNKLIHEVITALKFDVERRNITIHFNPSKKPAFILAESEKMLRVFYNLVGNAVKYIFEGGNIFLDTARKQEKIIITIEDDGPGMSEEEIINLFTLYYRTEEAEQSAVSGTGLGLFIVKTLLEAHNGQITVQSKPGEGMKFTIQLPEHTGFDRQNHS